MIREDLAIKIKSIINKDIIIITINKVQEIKQIMKIKEKIIMVTLIKDKIDLKGLITSIILKKLIKEMVHPKIIKKVDFKTINSVVMVTNMNKREDFKIEGAKCRIENMEIFISKKMIGVLIVKKKGILQENVKNQKMKTIETLEEDITQIEE